MSTSYWWTLGAAQYNHSLLLVDTGSCPVQPQSPTGGGHWELPSTTTVFYWWWTLGAAQYNHSLLLVDTGSCPVQPQSATGGHWELPSTTTVSYWWWTLGAAQYNHSLLLVVDTGSCPVQPQSATGGHWELPSTTTVFYWWWTLGAAQYNHSLLMVVDTGSCPVQPQSPTTLGAAQYNHSLTGGGHWELPSTTTVCYWWWTLGAAQYNHSLHYWWWTLGAAQYNHSLLLVVDTGSCPVQPQSATGGGHWELPSTTTVWYFQLLFSMRESMLEYINICPPFFGIFDEISRDEPQFPVVWVWLHSLWSSVHSQIWAVSTKSFPVSLSLSLSLSHL